jgi:hypothetical protein
MESYSQQCHHAPEATNCAKSEVIAHFTFSPKKSSKMKFLKKRFVNKYSCLFLHVGAILLLGGRVSAQVVVNNGAYISVASGAVMSFDTLYNDTSAAIANEGALKIKTIENSGALQGSGTYSLTGTFSNTGTFSPENSTFAYCGAAQSILGIDNAVSYYNLSLAGTGTKTFGANTTRISGTFAKTSVVADAVTNASTIEYNGENQSIKPITYYNLTLSNTGTKTFETGNTYIKNAFSIVDSATADATSNPTTIVYSGITPQTVKALSYHNLSFQGAAVKTLEAGTMHIAGNFTASAAYTDAVTNVSTVDFNGSGTQTIPAITYYNLASANTGNRTLAAGSINIKYSFSPGSNTYTVPTTNTLVFNGEVPQAIPSFAYNNLTVNNTNTRLAGDISVAKNLTLTDYDTLSLDSFTAVGGGLGFLKIPAHAALYVPNDNFPGGFGSYTLTGMVNYNGNGTETIYPANYANLVSSNSGDRILPAGEVISVSGSFDPGTNNYTTTGSTVNFNGTILQNLPPLASSSYNNLIVSNRGKTVLTGNITVTGNVALNNLSPFELSTFTVNRTTYGGTFTVDSACTLYVGGNFPSNFASYILNGTVNFNGAEAQTIPALNYYNLTSSNTGSRTLDTTGTIYIRGAFIDGSNTYNTLGSTINFCGTGTQTIPVFLNYYNLVSSSTGNRTLAAGSINIKYNFSPGTNTYTVPTTNTVTFNGTLPQTIPAFSYNNLTINNLHASLGGNINVAKNLTLTDYDTLDLATYTVTNSGEGLLKIPAHAAMYVPANNFPGSFGTYSLTGMVNYNGSGTETIFPATYAYLVSSNTGNRIIPNGSTLLLSGIFEPGTNSYTTTGSTVNFSGTALQTLPPLASSSYNNLIVSNRGKAILSGDVSVTGNVALNNVSPFELSSYTVNRTSMGGSFTVDSACTLFVGANFPSNFGSYVMNGTVTFNGTVPQTIPALNYYNLTSTGTGARTLDSNGTIYIRNAFAAGSNAYTTSGSTVNFVGTAAQTIPGLTFHNLILSNNANVSLGGNVTVKNSLKLDGGQVTTTTRNLSVTNTVPTAITRTTGYINGKLTRSMATNTGYMFPVGDADGYRPVSIAPVNGGSTAFSVEFKGNDPTLNGYNTDSVFAGVTGVNTNYYWKVLRTAGTDSANIKFACDDITSYSASPIAVLWSAKWKGVACSADVVNHTVTAHNVKTFGAFNFAYTPSYGAKTGRGTASVGSGAAIAASLVEVFPNPVADEMNMRINMENAGTVSVKVLSISGAEVASYNANAESGSQTLRFDAKNWAAGMYIYQVLLNNETESTGKFLKK